MGCAATKTVPANSSSELQEEVHSSGSVVNNSTSMGGKDADIRNKMSSKKEESVTNNGGVTEGEDDVFVEDEDLPHNNNERLTPSGGENGTDFLSNKKLSTKKDVPLFGPVYAPSRQTSQSQTEFFKMLDDKIAQGKSFSSAESIR